MYPKSVGGIHEGMAERTHLLFPAASTKVLHRACCCLGRGLESIGMNFRKLLPANTNSRATEDPAVEADDGLATSVFVVRIDEGERAEPERLDFDALDLFAGEIATNESENVLFGRLGMQVEEEEANVPEVSGTSSLSARPNVAAKHMGAGGKMWHCRARAGVPERRR